MYTRNQLKEILIEFSQAPNQVSYNEDDLITTLKRARAIALPEVASFLEVYQKTLLEIIFNEEQNAKTDYAALNFIRCFQKAGYSITPNILDETSIYSKEEQDEIVRKIQEEGYASYDEAKFIRTLNRYKDVNDKQSLKVSLERTLLKLRYNEGPAYKIERGEYFPWPDEPSYWVPKLCQYYDYENHNFFYASVYGKVLSLDVVTKNCVMLLKYFQKAGYTIEDSWLAEDLAQNTDSIKHCNPDLTIEADFNETYTRVYEYIVYKKSPSVVYD